MRHIQCPDCKTTSPADLTWWMRGTFGYRVIGTLSKRRLNVDEHSPTEEDVGFDAVSCQCGYESTDEKDFIVEE
tara:strand:+ start:1001 stop:1222 length:222 start_codon:yes stop_codon:yes gene_type:complete